MKKKWIAMGMTAAMLLTGCGAARKETSMEDTGMTGVGSMSGGADGDYYSSASESKMASGGERVTAAPESPAEEEPCMDWAGDMVVTEEGTDSFLERKESVDSSAECEKMPEEEYEVQIPPAAGLLTAGEWCDNENWGFFTNLITTHRFNFQVFGLMPYERVVVHAVSNGAAVKQARVELFDARGAVMASAVTDHEGTAYLYYHSVGEGTEPSTVMLQTHDGAGSVTAELAMAESSIVAVPPMEVIDGQNGGNGQETGYDFPEEAVEKNQGITAVVSHELTVEMPNDTTPVKKLDLMFVFDTTGSMGDELLYLQTEFGDIAEKVADQSTRISVNFYRDKGDVYVVRSNPFMQDFQKVASLINAESADGGGDYEEAVDLALQEAVFEHAWETESVKLLFLILDAPPHDTETVRENLAAVVKEAAKQGIRIIPIASSGVDATSEALLRSLAMMTGGTYTFLTDDSGIGGSHLEPTIGDYEVEALNDLIVRLILEYYQ